MLPIDCNKWNTNEPFTPTKFSLVFPIFPRPVTPSRMHFPFFSLTPTSSKPTWRSSKLTIHTHHEPTMQVSSSKWPFASHWNGESEVFHQSMKGSQHLQLPHLPISIFKAHAPRTFSGASPESDSPAARRGAPGCASDPPSISHLRLATGAICAMVGAGACRVGSQEKCRRFMGKMMSFYLFKWGSINLSAKIIKHRGLRWFKQLDIHEGFNLW